MLEYGKRKGSAMNIEIAQRLYELRRKHGFSQESLASALGLSRQAISKWERSESAPDMGNLIALADLYGMTIDELIRPCDECKENEAVEDGIANAKTAEGECVDAESAEGAVVNTGTAEGETLEAEEVIEAVGVVESVEVTNETANNATESPTAAAKPLDATATSETFATDVKQVIAHGHIYTRPTSPVRPRCKLRSIPYPLIVTIIFLVLGFLVSFWEYLWLFITIPFYYWIARIIERDPKFLAEHGFNADGTYRNTSEAASVDAVDNANGNTAGSTTGNAIENVTEITGAKEAE